MSTQTLLIFCLTILHTTFAAHQECSINIKNGMHELNPPIILTSSSPGKPLYPTISNPTNLTFNHNDKFTVACPGISNQKSTEILEPGNLLLKNHSINQSNSIIQCLNNDHFKINGKTVLFSDISCEIKPRASYSAILRPSTKKSKKCEIFEIGYDLGEQLGFLKTIELCHNEDLAQTLWSHAIIEPVDQSFVRYTGGSVKNFRTASLYDGMSMSMNEPYNLQVAYDTLAQIFGGRGDVDDYLSTKISDRKFLAKGHLIANADKLYKYEQESTYFYANAVPMWQSINASPGNWFFVEEYVRHLAYEKSRKFDVYVGGIDTLKIENKEFYLYEAEKIPVPKVLFKCVIDKIDNEGLCFMVVNNPYIKADDIEDYVVCKKSKVCEKLGMNYKDTSLGYLYCCNIKSFYKIAKNELGLGEEFKSMKNYKQMKLVTFDKNSLLIQ